MRAIKQASITGGGGGQMISYYVRTYVLDVCGLMFAAFTDQDICTSVCTYGLYYDGCKYNLRMYMQTVKVHKGTMQKIKCRK